MARNGLAYTTEEIDWLKRHVDDASWADITEMFNERFQRIHRSVKGLQRAATSNKIFKSVKYISDVPLKKEHIDFIKRNRNGNSVKDIIGMFYSEFGILFSYSAMEAHMHRQKIYREDNHLRKPIGSEAIRKGEVYIKVKDTGNGKKDWVLKGRFIYEKHHGKFKRGEMLVFLDGDKLNTDISNLYKVSLYVMCNLRAYNWLFKGQKDLQMCAIKWCECAEYIRDNYNPDFNMKEWARRERIHELY